MSSRRTKNKLSAHHSRQRRMAYVLQLELNLKHAVERIRDLEAQLRHFKVDAIVTDGCMLSEAFIDPVQIGAYYDL